MRRPFKAADRGWSRAVLRWRIETGIVQRVGHGILLDGDEPPNALELALGCLVATGGAASGCLAGVMHELDGVVLSRPWVSVPSRRQCKRSGVRHHDLDPRHVMEVAGYQCTDGLQTLVDLAGVLDDERWEQALESALRRDLVTVDELVEGMEQRRSQRVAGMQRMRRVLKIRPPGAPPTESLLETLMVQLIRSDAHLPTPTRQVEVLDWDRRFVARVDLAWPELGVFIELDGEQHKDQPRYDARRETAVVAATGWLPARFTWHEVVRCPKSTLRRLSDNVRKASSKR